MGEIVAFILIIVIAGIVAIIPLSIVANIAATMDSVTEADRPFVYGSTLIAIPLMGIALALIGVGNALRDIVGKLGEKKS
ncbi:MAG: hypothetical protein R3B94_04795 [Hyphomonas sp.]